MVQIYFSSLVSVKRKALSLVFFFFMLVANAQFSTTHYMPVSVVETRWGIDDPTYFLTSLPGVNTTVRVMNTIDGSLVTTLNLQDGQTTIYPSPYLALAEGPNAMGLKFESDEEFSIVGNGDPANTLMSHGWSSKGEASIGHDFGVFTPAIDFRINSNYGIYLSVLAVEDTDVTLSNFPEGNGTFSLKTGEGNVFFMGNSNDYSAFMAGHITSTGSIVVLNQTNQMYNGGIENFTGGSDNGADILVAQEYLGTEYIIGRTALAENSSEYVGVVGAQDNTEVIVNGTSKGIIDKGELLLLDGEDWAADVVMHVTTNQPAYVWHKSNTYNPLAPTAAQQDGYLLVPPVRLCGNSQNQAVIAENAFQGSTAGRVIVIVSKADATVTLNGTVQAKNETIGDFDFYRIAESQGATATIESTEALTVTVVSFDSDASTGVSYAGWEITAQAEIEVTTDGSGGCNPLSTVDISTTGGSGNFLYYLSEDPIPDENDPQYYVPESTFTDLTTGTYIVWIYDVDTGCPLEAEAVVPPSTDLVNTVTATQQSCALDDGRIDISTTGGSGNYVYYVSTDPIPDEDDLDNYGTQNMFGGLAPGVYEVWMMDVDAGCPVPLDPVTLMDPSAQAVPYTTVPISCDGNDGSLTFDVTDEVADQLFYVGQTPLADPSDSSLYGSETSYSGLAAGDYEVWTMDVATGCYLQLPNARFFETDLSGVAAGFDHPSCRNDDGAIMFTGTGGSGNLVYYASQDPIGDANDPTGYTSDNRFEGLSPGEYHLWVLDLESGCPLELPRITLDGVPALEGELLITDVGCSGNDGEIQVVSGDAQVLGAQGGSGGSYSYQLLLDGSPVGGAVSEPVFSNLSPGRYSVEITDGGMCPLVTNEQLILALDLSAEIGVDYACNGDTVDNTVTVRPTDSSLEGQVMYALDGTEASDFQMSPVFENVAVGSHFVAILHANGCLSMEMEFEITAFQELELSVAASQTRVNTIDAVVSGGQAPYRYFLNGGQVADGELLRISRTGDYEVMVIDALGCTAVATIFMEHMDICIPNFFTPDGDGNNDGWRLKNQDDYPNIETLIYDRYGRVVARLPLNVSWDGDYEGEPMPTGDYWYVVNLNDISDTRTFVGHFSLYR